MDTITGHDYPQLAGATEQIASVRAPDVESITTRGRDGHWELIAMSPVPRVKISAPQLPPEFVARSELCADLDAGATGDVALVCAPAGYGKTLLLADWSRTSTAVDTAWVGVDRD